MAYRSTAKTKAHRAAQHKRLLDAALLQVAEGGFQALTINRVAERAQVATGSVYKYFDSKADLCAQVFRQASGKEVAKVAATAKAETSVPNDNNCCSARLMATIEVFAKRAILGRRMAYALIAEPVDPVVEAERLTYREAYASVFSQLIEEGMASGEFPQQFATISAAAIVGALSEALVGPLTAAINKNTDIDDKALIAAIQRFCLAAVTSDMRI